MTSGCNFKVYQNYSFEEIRYTSPPVKRSGENMLVRGNSDGTYCATWAPAATGCFSIIVNIDGYDLEEVSYSLKLFHNIIFSLFRFLK